MQERDYSAMGDGELVRLSNEGDSLAGPMHWSDVMMS